MRVAVGAPLHRCTAAGMVADPSSSHQWASPELAFLCGVVLLPALRLLLSIIHSRPPAASASGGGGAAGDEMQALGSAGRLDTFYAVDQPARLLLNLPLDPAHLWMNFGLPVHRLSCCPRCRWRW